MQTVKKLTILKARLNKVIARGKSNEFPGVRRKLERKIRTLEARL